MKFTILALASLAAAAADWSPTAYTPPPTPSPAAALLSSPSTAATTWMTPAASAGQRTISPPRIMNGDCEGPNLGQVTAVGRHFDAAASSVSQRLIYEEFRGCLTRSQCKQTEVRVILQFWSCPDMGRLHSPVGKNPTIARSRKESFYFFRSFAYKPENVAGSCSRSHEVILGC
ncbi:hypothetical protein GE09DRAFT_1055477 [Coniochaeta sp. 2T2.1]|nr:hypothetical protein GE09DRAFT_1055477 [Coniochaeta sp. 2T2.1]